MEVLVPSGGGAGVWPCGGRGRDGAALEGCSQVGGPLGGGVGVRSPRLGRRVLEQLGADGQGEAPSFLQRPPPLPASTMDGAEGEGRVPTMGWLHFGVLMPILHANSVRLIRVCSRVDSLRGLFPCSPGRRGKTLIEWCLVRKSPPPPPEPGRPRPGGGGGLTSTVETTCRVWLSSTYVWPVQPRSQVFIFLLTDFRVSCHRWLVAPTLQL